MKSTVEVEEQVRELLLAELKQRLTRPRLPTLCLHNHRHALDHRKSVYGEPNASYNRVSQGVEEVDGARVALPVVQTIGLCMMGAESIETWPGNICEEAIDAQRCPYFKYRQSRSEVYDGFVANVTDPSWVKAFLPAVHSLLWVLGVALRVEPASWLALQWERVLRVLRRRAKKSVDLLVYLPKLDAWPDEDSAGAASPH